MSKNAVVLLSGGVDSATTLANFHTNNHPVAPRLLKKEGRSRSLPSCLRTGGVLKQPYNLHLLGTKPKFVPDHLVPR